VTLTRREIVAGTAAAAASLVSNQPAAAQSGQGSGVQPEDRVFICNEDSRRRRAPSTPATLRRRERQPASLGPKCTGR